MIPQASAVGKLRGYNDVQLPLAFVRRDPYVLPRRSLTGDGNERVDTRLLQVIYAFENQRVWAFTGRQMDVFIESEPVGQTAQTRRGT